MIKRLRCFLFGYWMIVLFANICLIQNTNAQTIRGKVKGKVVDKVTQLPLPGANIVLLKTPLGAASDLDGNFLIENIPVGRYDIKVTYVGYESEILPEILIGSGKTINLNVNLKESPIVTEGVSVLAHVAKDKPLNDMVLVSGRRFSVEEARRYAGGIDDPARLASSFSGVATGLTEDNGIVIRGNAPKGILWQLEGIEIPNPNHFFGMTSFGGGGVSALSSMMLESSDFLTGAFPAEYGNALSGVFDLKLKTGNRDDYEHTIQLGFLGLDFASEGPMVKGSNASYAFNYRYSTMGLVKHFMSEDVNIPSYQDLAFKFNVPTQKAGIFSLWGLGFLDDIAEIADEDTTTWEYADDNDEYKTNLDMGVLGLTHRLILSDHSYLNTTLAMTRSGVTVDDWEVDADQNKSPIKTINSKLSQGIISTTLFHKFNAYHYNETGIRLRQLAYQMNIQKNLDDAPPLEQIVKEDGNSQLYRAFTQSEFRIHNLFTINLGLNAQYFALNKNRSIEPRASFKWNLQPNQSLSFGYGLHSRLEELFVYMAQQKTKTGFIRPNMDLDFTRAHHFVLGYDVNLTAYTHLKIEPYYQYLVDVPVVPDSSYSLLNMEADWYFNETLKNTGRGVNAGVDITLERYLNNNYYYLITTSLFQSKYKGGDGIWRNTRFDRNLVMNVLGGKEWILGEEKNRIFGVNLRFQLLGGRRYSPLDRMASLDAMEDIYDETRAFEAQEDMSYHFHVTLTYRINKPGRSEIWAFQLFNFPSSADFEGYQYNFKTGKMDETTTHVFFPLLSYKVEF